MLVTVKAFVDSTPRTPAKTSSAMRASRRAASYVISTCTPGGDVLIHEVARHASHADETGDREAQRESQGCQKEGPWRHDRGLLMIMI